jgi:hypothetical protein
MVKMIQAMVQSVSVGASGDLCQRSCAVEVNG